MKNLVSVILDVVVAYEHVCVMVVVFEGEDVRAISHEMVVMVWVVENVCVLVGEDEGEDVHVILEV